MENTHLKLKTVKKEDGCGCTSLIDAMGNHYFMTAKTPFGEIVYHGKHPSVPVEGIVTKVEAVITLEDERLLKNQLIYPS